MKKGYRFDEVFDLEMGKTPSRDNNEYWESGEYAWVSIRDLNQGKYVSETKEKISKKAVNETGIKCVKANTVLMSFKLSIGKVSIAKSNLYTNEAIMAFNSKPHFDIKPDFLYYYLQGFDWGLGNRAVMGVTLNKSSLSAYKISIPSIVIQSRIISELDTLNTIITKKKQQLEELDKLAQATFYEMFGDPITNSKKWDVEIISSIGTLNRGISKHRPRNAEMLLGGPYPLIQTGDVANASLFIEKFKQTYSEVGLKQSKLWPKGTLCITIAANIAKTAILDYDACFPDSVVGFIPNVKTNSIFMHFWFSFFQKILESQAPEVAQKNINLKILNELKVIVPPKELQNIFVRNIELIESQKSLIQQSLTDTQQLFDYTMNKYFGS